MGSDLTDHGRTWSKARHMGGGVEGPVKNKPIQFEDGTILCGSSDEPSGRQWQVYYSRTKDLGQSWQITGPWNDPAIIQSSDGDVRITYTYERRNISHVRPRALPSSDADVLSVR